MKGTVSVGANEFGVFTGFMDIPIALFLGVSGVKDRYTYGKSN